MFGYTGNPHEEHDRSFYARERAAATRDATLELQADSMMIDCLDREDAEAINRDNDLYDGDLLTDMMVLVARAQGASMTATEAVAQMASLMRAEFRKIAARECDK